MKPLLFLFINSFLLISSCRGQNKQSKATIGSEVSELSNSILLIYQASNGNYWFGSDVDGVYRYDGKSIVHYSEKDGLSNNRIRSIQEDKQGNIYFATLGGVCKFDGQTITTLIPLKSISPADNWKLQPDDLWFSMPGKNGDKGPYRFDGTNLYQLEFPIHYLKDTTNKPWSSYEVYFIFKDHEGAIWFGTAASGLCRYDGKSHRWMYEDHLTNIPNGGSFGIRSIAEDKDGKLWICNTSYRYSLLADSVENDKTLVNYDRQKGIEGLKSTNGDDHIYFMSAINDHLGNLWMATYDQGVWRYDGTTSVQFVIKDGSKNVNLYAVYQDRNGTIWLGTHEAGVYKFNGLVFEKFAPMKN